MPLSLWQYALYLLARREYSCCELRKKLLTRQQKSRQVLAEQSKIEDQQLQAEALSHPVTTHDPLVEETLSRLEAEGYLSDARFIESFVRGKVLRQKNGPLKVRHALSAKGISIQGTHQISQILGVLPEDEADYWVQQCTDAIQKKWRGKSHYTLKEKAALFAFLQRKGFCLEDIQRAFRAYTVRH